MGRKRKRNLTSHFYHGLLPALRVDLHTSTCTPTHVDKQCHTVYLFYLYFPSHLFFNALIYMQHTHHVHLNDSNVFEKKSLYVWVCCARCAYTKYSTGGTICFMPKEKMFHFFIGYKRLTFMSYHLK